MEIIIRLICGVAIGLIAGLVFEALEFEPYALGFWQGLSCAVGSYASGELYRLFSQPEKNEY